VLLVLLTYASPVLLVSLGSFVHFFGVSTFTAMRNNIKQLEGGIITCCIAINGNEIKTLQFDIPIRIQK
jgi:hypothetical protein